MSNKSKIYLIAFSFLLIFKMAVGQTHTSEWRVVWDRNADVDSVEYYLIYKAENRTPTLSDLIDFEIPQPESGAQDSVVYPDNNIEIGKRYVYSAIAVDSLDRRSGFSNTDDAAIPEILFPILKVPAGKVSTLNLNEANYINYPGFDASSLVWDQPVPISGNQISISIDQNNTTTFDAPSDTTIEEAFTFRVQTDPEGFFHSRQVTVSLYDETTPNRAPEFTTQLDSVLHPSGREYQQIVAGSDPDGDDIRFFLKQAPDFLEIDSVSATSARLYGTPDTTDAGDHTVIVSVTDELLTTDQTYVLTITKAPGAPVPDEDVQSYPLPFVASKHDGIRFSNFPDGGELKIFNLLGELVFEDNDLPSDYLWEVVNSSGTNINAGVYIFHVKAKDDSKPKTGKLLIVR